MLSMTIEEILDEIQIAQFSGDEFILFDNEVITGSLLGGSKISETCRELENLGYTCDSESHPDMIMVRWDQDE